MCIISLSRPGQIIPDLPTIRRMWQRNPDGAGYVISHRKPVDNAITPPVVRKGFMELEDFIHNLRTDLHQTRLQPGAVCGPTATVAMHFRIGTHGANNPANTHPWEVVPGRVWLMHNGIIRTVDPNEIEGADPTASDSQWYAAMLKPIITPALSKFKPGASIFEYHDDEGRRVKTRFAKSLREHIEAYIGSYNKVLLFDANGGVLLCNAQAGMVSHAHQGTWFSNSGFLGTSSSDVCDPRLAHGRGTGTGTGSGQRFHTHRPKVHLPGGTIAPATTVEALQRNLFAVDEPFVPRLKALESFKRADEADHA